MHPATSVRHPWCKREVALCFARTPLFFYCKLNQPAQTCRKITTRNRADVLRAAPIVLSNCAIATWSGTRTVGLDARVRFFALGTGLACVGSDNAVGVAAAVCVTAVTIGRDKILFKHPSTLSGSGVVYLNPAVLSADDLQCRTGLIEPYRRR